MKHLNFLRMSWYADTLHLLSTFTRPDSVSSPCRCRVLSILLLCLTLGAGQMWGAVECVELNATNLSLSGSYSSNSTGVNVSEITFKFDNLIKNNGDVGIRNYTTAGIWNTTEMPQKIDSVILSDVRYSGGSPSTIEVYGANTVKGTTTKIYNNSGSGKIKVDFTSYNYKYFFISRGGTNRVAYASSIKIYYTAASNTPTITPSVTELDWGSVLQGTSQNTKAFSISGSNLASGSLTISATGGYSVDKTSQSVNGTLNATTITVTPPSTATTGTKNGKVTISGGGLTSDVEIDLSMTVNAAYPVHYYVNGSEVVALKEIVASGGKVSALPDKDDVSSCDETKYPYFNGWSSDNFGSRTTAPTTLVTGNEPINVETSYYAVFAAGTDDSGTLTFSFEDDDDETGWTNIITGTSSLGDYVTPHDGSKAAHAKSSTTTIIQTSDKIIPTAFSAYITKESGNTSTPASWVMQKSTDGSSWSDVATWSATSPARGTWSKITLSAEQIASITTPSYIKIILNTTVNAYRDIDDISLSYGSVEYTKWITTCCNELGQINGSISLFHFSPL